MKKAFIGMLFIAITACSMAKAGTLLTLADYLGQVRSTGPAYLQSLTNRQNNDTFRLLLGKHWSGNIQAGLSEAGDNTTAWNYQYNPPAYSAFYNYLTGNEDLGGSLYFNNDWNFGLSTSVSENFQWNHQWEKGYPWLPYLNNGLTDNFSFNVGIPLWENFLGRSVRAQDKRDFLNNDSGTANDEFQIQSVLYNATLAYFSLAQTRADLACARETLKTYADLLEWARGHSTVDLLQAETAVEGEELVVERMEDQERQGRDDFNRWRGMEGSQVDEIQSLDDLNQGVKDEWDAGGPDRLDLQAARLGLESSRNGLVVDQEGTNLDVELTGTLGGNLFGNNSLYPAPPPLSMPYLQNYSVGLSLNVPFDFFTSRWDAAYRIDKLNLGQQEINLKTTVYNDNRQWEDMTLRFNRSSVRIGTATLRVEHSRQEMDLGEKLLKGGRIGLYEVLGFVGVHDAAVSDRQAWLGQRLGLLAQAEWYKARKGQWMTGSPQ